MTWWVVIIIFILIAFSYLRFKKFYAHKNSIGQHIIINYFDQNIYIENTFPLKGIISRKIKIGMGTFFIVNLDNSFIYNDKEYNTIIIKERHVGYYIGQNKEIHVHVLLPKIKLDNRSYSLKDFDHVVWAIIELIK